MSVPAVDAVTVDAVGFARFGGPEVLQRLRVVVPPSGAGQVRVRVAAAAVNPADTYLRSGRFRFVLPVRRPFVPGLDVAGVVDAGRVVVDERLCPNRPVPVKPEVGRRPLTGVRWSRPPAPPIMRESTA